LGRGGMDWVIRWRLLGLGQRVVGNAAIPCFVAGTVAWEENTSLGLNVSLTPW
jgi:hypothetical protein